MSFTQYLKDTRGELHHVAWPTRTDTIVYTALVALISVGIALYLGFFDFLFTTGLARVLNVTTTAANQNPIQVSNVHTATTTPTTPASTATTTGQDNSIPLIKTN